MKVGNITFQWSYNCGSILQCMGLRFVLQSGGHEVSVINFSTPAQRQLYSVFYSWSGARNVVKNLLCIPGRRVIADHYSQYEGYIRRQFGYGDAPMPSSSMLRNQLPQFDALVAGGDQIWNVKCSDFDSAYFLDFAENTYKFSYSPSLGATDINESPRAAEFAKLLESFEGISCREPNGVRRLETLTGREVSLALDPTLLLTADEWRSQVLDASSRYPEGGFIFYYAFSYSADNNARVQQLAEELNMSVVVLDAKEWYIRRLMRYRNFVLSHRTGPDAFLHYVDSAAYVVTTSFHGTAFSLLFKKRFAYINIPTHEAGDDRTSFLLERLGLMDRFISVGDLTVKMLDGAVDYDAVFERLGGFKKESLEYLNGQLDRAADVL